MKLLRLIVFAVPVWSGLLICASAQTPAPNASSSVVKLPQQLEVERRGLTTYVGVVDFQPVELTVTPNLIRGTQWEENILYRGKVLSLGGGMTSEFKVERFADVLTRGEKQVPAGDDEFTFQYKIRLFETDEPTGRHWSPAHGQHYKVLWSHTFEEVIKR